MSVTTELRWPCFRRRHRLRPRRGRYSDGVIERACVIRIDNAARQRVLPAFLAGDRRQPLDEARAYRRRARLLGGTCEDDLARTQSLREVMRRQADAQLRQIETEFEPHRTAQPRIAAGVGRPGAFIEAAQHNVIRALQPRFQQAKDAYTRIGAFGAPFGAAGTEQAENIRIVDRGKHKRRGGLAVLNGFENALQLQAVGVVVGSNCAAIVRQRLERFGVPCASSRKLTDLPVSVSSGASACASRPITRSAASRSAGWTKLRGSFRCRSPAWT